MGNQSSNYSEYRSINEAHEALEAVLRENPQLSSTTKSFLRELRSDIYNHLEGERNCRISLYISGENGDQPYKFKIGSGREHLVVTINDEGYQGKFASGRSWSRVRNYAASMFKSILGGLFGAAIGGGIGFLTAGPAGAAVGASFGFYQGYRGLKAIKGPGDYEY